MKNLIAFFSILLLLSSCKAKYEELLGRYNTTLDKKKETIKDHKHYENKIRAANDSIHTLLPEYLFWQRYRAESEEIARLKTGFIKNVLKP
jgi:hypothetical protein